MAEQEDKVKTTGAAEVASDDIASLEPVVEPAAADAAAEEEPVAEDTVAEESVADQSVTAEPVTEAETAAAEAEKQQNPNQRWYVVHAYSGFESYVKKVLESRIATSPHKKKFGDIMVPTEEVVEMREGNRRKSERKFFPGRSRGKTCVRFCGDFLHASQPLLRSAP